MELQSPLQPTPAIGTTAPESWGLRTMDVWIFRWMRAGHGARPRGLWAARQISRWSALPMLLLMTLASMQAAGGWWHLVLCLLVAGVAQLVSKKLAAKLGAPRPFMLGLSPNHLDHGSRTGFPSTHAVVMGTVIGFMCMVAPAAWPLVVGMAAVKVCTCWSRIHGGAHFPSDVVAGAIGGASFGAIAAHLVT